MADPTITPEAQELAQEAEQMLTVAQEYRIATADEYQRGADELRRIKAKAKELDATRKAMTKPLDDSKKQIMDFFRQPLGFLERAERAIKGAMLDYQREEERKRQEEERRLQEEARKEQERLKQEAEEQALAAMESGDEDKANALLDAELYIPPPVAAKSTPKAEGIHTRELWKGRVTDKAALIQAVANGQAPASLLIVDEKVLGQMARSLKGSVTYTGVEFYAEQTVSAR